MSASAWGGTCGCEPHGPPPADPKHSESVKRSMRAPRHADNGRELAQRVAHNLRRRCNVADGARILVAVSGGRDSVALLHVLASLAREHELALGVAHFDHRLRPDSGDDAHWVERLAEQLHLQACVGTWDHPVPGEDAARRARHVFLQQTARARACDVIALAHHLEDQIETVLLRHGRGSGPRGLLGMAWRRQADVDIVRPLLDCRREVLAAYLERSGQTWREDPTNADRSRSRNRVRHGVLPALEQALGDTALESWADSLDDLRSLWEHSRAVAAQLLLDVRRRSPLDGKGRIEVCDVSPFRRAPDAVCAVAVQMWLESVGCQNLRRQHIRGVKNLLQTGHSGHHIDLPGDRQLTLEQDSVVVRSRDRRDQIGARPIASGPPARRRETSKATNTPAPPGAVNLIVETANAVPGAAQIRRESTRTTAPDAIPAELIAWVDPDVADPHTWIVRMAEPGERVRLLGAPGFRKLARVFQDSRVPERLRAAWPVVADAAGVVWVPGIGVAQRVRIRSGTRRAARLVLRRPS